MSIGVEIVKALKEAYDFFEDLASGEMTIEDARKRAKELKEKKPATFTDELLREQDERIEELEK